MAGFLQPERAQAEVAGTDALEPQPQLLASPDEESTVYRHEALKGNEPLAGPGGDARGLQDVSRCAVRCGCLDCVTLQSPSGC